MARPERIRLGDLLIQEALITATQLDEALADQKKSGRKLGRIFIERQWVTEEQIARAVARQLRAPFLELGPRSVRPEVARLLPEGQARRLRALPLAASAVNETDSIVRVRDGQIVAIGGLMKQELRDERTGLPVVSEAPVVGGLFRQTGTVVNKRELVIMLKPTVIGNDAWPDAPVTTSALP